MPKYEPTYDDMYSTKPCFICGRDVLDDDTDTCSYSCRSLRELYESDLEWMMLKEMERREGWEDATD